MAKRKNVTVNTSCVADRYADEKIIEFTTADGQLGGLIAFRYPVNGCLVVELYRLDDGVRVSLPGDDMSPDAFTWGPGR